MSETNDTSMAAFLKDHPRMTGVLFTMLLLLSEAGAAAAANGSTTVGP